MSDQTGFYRNAFLTLPGLAPLPVGPTSSWGAFNRFLSFGDDQFVLREVDLFENGNGLVYDREQWTDIYGALVDARFDERWIEQWGPPITISQTEFEYALQIAFESSGRARQIEAASRAPRLPLWPVVTAWQTRHVPKND